MNIKEEIVFPDHIFLLPGHSGLARLDSRGMIREGDSVFASLLHGCHIQPDKVNLLEFLEKKAEKIPGESISGKQKGISQQKIYRYHYTGQGKGTGKKILDFRVCPVSGEASQEYIVSVSDITNIWKKEILLQLLVDISNAVILSHDLTELIHDVREGLGKIMDTTNFFVALYNEEDDSLSFPFFDDAMDHFEKVPAKGTLTAHILHSGKASLLKEEDFRLLRKDGSVDLVGTDSKVWMGAPLRADGEVFGVISVQNYEDEDTYDDTDKEILDIVASQIGLAIDRKRKQEDISAGKTYFEKLFHYAPVPIVIQKHPGIISDVNDAFESLFGYKADEVIGKSIDEVVVPEEYRDEGVEITNKAFSGELIEREVFRKHRNGTLLQVALKAKSFQISPGETIVYAIYQDISQKKEYERKLVEAKNKAEEADRLKSAFLTNMSHEIRTPMNAILGFSQLLASTGIPVGNKREYTRIILDSGENLLRLIDDILDLAKIESGQMEIRKESVDVEDMMNALQATFLEMIEKKLQKDLELKLVIPRSANPLLLNTDPLRLKQILVNLIGNAIKFTQKGKIEMGYTLHEDKNEVEFFVKDTGIGIPTNKLQLIFDRFQQVDNSRTRQYSGTGLGLAISKKLTTLLGGDIRVNSKEGKGSEFTFTIPLPGEIRKPEIKPQPGVITDFPDLSRFKVLLAEDDEINFLFMREILKKTGVKLIRATNGFEVMKYIRKNKGIDLILMDMEMPEMNGYEATMQLKKDYPQIPVIAQTAYASPEEKNKCLETGCDDYIAKPIQMHKLYTLLRQYLKD
ncbi:MAG: response regulator [Chlorobi bacterium]|nr:response regulator [Chlorobiota bacterium]